MLTGNVGSEVQQTAPAGKLHLWIMAATVVVSLAIWPGSQLGPSTLTDWHDQAVFLRAATQTIEQGLPDSVTQTLVGPAYVALTLIIGWLSGLDPAQSLLLLSRLTFVTCAAILATVAMRYRVQADLAFQLTLGAIALLSLGTSVWFRFLDIPWTHFVAAALLGTMVLVTLSRLPLFLRAAFIGVLAITLLQTRLFEALVALIAALIILPVAAARHWRVLRTQPVALLAQLVLPTIAGGALGFVAIGLVSHNWTLYQQYGDQAGMVVALELVPLKAIQLFWDTCFGTVCAFAASPPVPVVVNTIDSWRQPLSLQLPGLIAAAGGLLVLLALRPRRALQLPLGILFAVVTAGGLVLAYVSGAPSGSPHLKYGFFRDFVPPLILLTSAFIGALAVQRAEDGRTGGVLLLSLLVYFVMLFGLTALRPVGLPPLAASQVERFEIGSSCAGGQCTFRLEALGFSGTTLPHGDLVYVTCSGDPQFRPIWRLSELKTNAGQCPRVTIVPLASGLLYTPEGDLIDALNLALPTDAIAIPGKGR